MYAIRVAAWYMRRDGRWRPEAELRLIYRRYLEEHGTPDWSALWTDEHYFVDYILRRLGRQPIEYPMIAPTGAGSGSRTRSSRLGGSLSFQSPFSYIPGVKMITTQAAVYLVNAHNGLALHVNDWNHDDGALVSFWETVAQDNMCWNITRLEGNTFSVRPVHSAKALDADWHTDSHRVHQWRWHGGDNQKWVLHEQGDGTYIIQNVGIGLVLDSPWDSTYNGAPVHLWDWHGGQNQRWRVNLSL
jgi:hypothetical protein